MRINPTLLQLRDFKLSDLPDVLAIETHVQPQQPWSENNFRDSFLAFHTMMVAEYQGKLVGFQVLLFGPDVVELLLIGVDPHVQGQGVGYALLQAAEQLAIRKGREAMLLEVRVSNMQAQKFYLGMGYSLVGRRKNYYQCGAHEREDALLLQKTFTKETR